MSLAYKVTFFTQATFLISCERLFFRKEIVGGTRLKQIVKFNINDKKILFLGLF